MGRQIIKQPNGKYLIFCNTVDKVSYYDMTRDEIINIDDDRRGIKLRSESIRRLDNGEKRLKDELTYNTMLDLIKRTHGKVEHNEIKRLIEH